MLEGKALRGQFNNLLTKILPGRTQVAMKSGVSKWAGTFTRLRSCIVPEEIPEPPKISGGQNHKYDWLVEYFS